MSDGSNDRLCARVDMDVLDNNPLFSAATELCQRVHIEQGLKAKPCIERGHHDHDSRPL
jgi:hypothetical protein